MSAFSTLRTMIASGVPEFQNRVFYERVPEGAGVPALVYVRRGREEPQTFGGSSEIVFHHVALGVFANGPDEAFELEDKVYAAILRGEQDTITDILPNTAASLDDPLDDVAMVVAQITVIEQLESADPLAGRAFSDGFSLGFS